MKITAVIPVRSGSQRVSDKNLRPFGDSCLLEVKIKELLNVPELTSIVVNTNSEEAITLVDILKKKLNIHKLTYHRREAYYASSACSGSEFFSHIAEVTDTDLFIYAPCTSPFIKASSISSCIKKFINEYGDECDCVSTVSSIKEFLWLENKPVNYEPASAPNSQNLPNIVALNFGCTVSRREDIIKNHNIIGKKPHFVETSDIEAIDIDTPLDFFIADQMYHKLIMEKKNLLD